ncbi:MAG: aminotransferase class V-fold PLP-dependent enzyme [bacterium]
MEKLIYLDNAATAWPKPEVVYNFMIDFYRRCGVNPGRSGFDLAIEAGSIVDGLRQKLTRFFGGDQAVPERLCYTYNATDALNLLIQGALKAGDHVISTNVEHNSVIRPINCMVRDHGVEATYIPFNDAGFVEPDEIKAAIKPNTRLVIVNHGSNVIGTIQPIAEIGRICHEAGVMFAIDASQTAGVVPINMQEMYIDVVAFTGHKALMGSTGIGGLCIREHVDLAQTRSGGTGVRSAYPYHLEDYPFRMEFGTPNVVGIAALDAGLGWIKEQGMENIRQREHKLLEKLIAGLREIDRVKVYCTESLKDHLSTVTINVDGIDAGDVGIMLDVEFNIATRTGLHCAPLVHQQLGLISKHGGVRFSVGAFNTEEHIDAAIEAMQEIATRKSTIAVGTSSK